MVSRHCATALTRVAEIEGSGELDPGSQLPEELRQLCSVLTGQGPAGSLQPSWSRMLDAAGRADGPCRHLDVGATLPAIDGAVVRVDSLSSGPESWRLYLRAAPSWWGRSEDGRHKWSVVSVHAKDDRGDEYLSNFGGSSAASGCEELSLEFLPRLNPLASGITLTFQVAHQQLAVDLTLDLGNPRGGPR